MTQQGNLISKVVNQLHDYHFCYDQRRPFDTHQSPLSIKGLLLIRVIAYAYLTFIYAWTLIQMKTFNTEIIYLTMIGYFLTWIYFGLSLQHYCFQGKYFKSPNLCKFIQIFGELAFCAQVPITIVFWTLLFKYVLQMDLPASQFFVQCNLHSVPMLFLSIDFIYNSLCYHIRHTMFLVVLTVVYLIINMVYSLMVKPIYAPLKWVDVVSYILALGCILSVLVVHFLARLLFRKWKCQRLQKNKVGRASLLKSEVSQTISGEIQIQHKQNSIFRKSVQL